MLHYWKRLVKWWNMENRERWEWEQVGIKVPVREWVLWARDHWTWEANDVIMQILVRYWKQIQSHWAPGISPLASFYCPLLLAAIT